MEARTRGNFDTFGMDVSFIKGRVNMILKFHAVETMGKNPVRRLRSGIRVRGRCTLQ